MRKTARHPARRSTPRRHGASAAATDATNRSIGLDDRLYSYLCEVTLREPELMAWLRAETSRLPRGTMQISPEQGQLMGLLVRLIGARRALEIGTFTGAAGNHLDARVARLTQLARGGRFKGSPVILATTDGGRRGTDWRAS
jgi:hypothetical protein